MSGIRIVTAGQTDRVPAASRAGTLMTLWAGLMLVLFGATSERLRWALVAAGVALCAFAWTRFKKVDLKVCPGCRAAIPWEAATCPSCKTEVP